MLQGKYMVPSPMDPQSLLARHEAGLFKENRATLASFSSHRSRDVNRLILPQCQPIMEAIGHRMAYDAAVAAGVQQDLVNLFVASAIKADAMWYSENAGFHRRDLVEFEAKALDTILPRLEMLVKNMRIEPWITAKIVTQNAWDSFLETCEDFNGNVRVDVFQSLPPSKIGRHLEMARSHL
jgi:acyl-CoA oxidase